MNNAAVSSQQSNLTFWQALMSSDPIVLMSIVMIPIIVGIVVVFMLVRYAGGKDTTNYKTYAPSGGRIIGARDRYTHTTETRMRVRQNNGGGHGGGHGGGFGGGGRGGFGGGGGHRGGGRGGR